MIDIAFAIDDKLRAMARVIVDACAPRRVVLFGSRARGDARPDSDYDIMVEVDDASPIDELRRTIYRRLSTRFLSAEVVLRTPTDFALRCDDPGYLDYDIAREGRVVYVRRDVAEAHAQQQQPRRVREPTPRPHDSVSLWIRRAEGDLQGMEDLLGSASPVAPAVCFHAHECAEKLLKALLLLEEQRPPRVHELTDLLALCPHEVKNDVVIVQACAILSALWPRSRYPDDREEPTMAEALDAAEAARIVRARVMPRLFL